MSEHANKQRWSAGLDLFLISLITLYFEILFIRWIPSNIQIFAYFSNIILLATFLGLGLGCLLSKLEFDLMNLFPLSLLGMVAMIFGFRTVEVSGSVIQGEHLLGVHPKEGMNFILLLAVIFIFNAAMVMPLGQKLGRCLTRFRPLIAYSINIGGSLAGIALYSFLAYLMVAPLWWFSLGLVLTLWLYAPSWRRLLVQAALMGLTVLMVSGIDPDSKWSPYYKIDTMPLYATGSNIFSGYFVAANNNHLQFILDLTDKSVAKNPKLQIYKKIYEFPYKLVHPRRVLILGAGTGNDTAAALRMDAREIYAVEIDPYIASLGKTLHEEHPYLAPNVRLAVDDARSFIRQSDDKYDLITFGYLDSHKVLSQFSSVRLDNFIYTRESLQDVKARLAPDGLLSITYLVFREWIGAKMYAALKDVFGDDLCVVRVSTFQKNDTAIYLAGGAVRRLHLGADPDFTRYEGFDIGATPITDNWPYLYLASEGIPSHYLWMLGVVLAISILGIFTLRSGSGHRFSTHFFFLGAGFMLLETASITRFALLFGSTWVVNSAVIGSILAMILLANLYVEKVGRIHPRLLYLLLIVSIFLNWWLGPEVYLSLSRVPAVVLSSLSLSLPLFFAGIIFAASFKATQDVSGMFAYNLLGAIMGGLLEYVSMATGFRFLFLVAIGLYCISFLGWKPSEARTAEAPQPA